MGEPPKNVYNFFIPFLCDFSALLYPIRDEAKFARGDTKWMHGLTNICVKLVEGVFLVGLAGSALVICLVTIEDVVVLLDNGESDARPE